MVLMKSKETETQTEPDGIAAAEPQQVARSVHPFYLPVEAIAAREVAAAARAEAQAKRAQRQAESAASSREAVELTALEKLRRDAAAAELEKTHAEALALKARGKANAAAAAAAAAAGTELTATPTRRRLAVALQMTTTPLEDAEAALKNTKQEGLQASEAAWQAAAAAE